MPDTSDARMRDVHHDAHARSVLIVGCGLIGTSFAASLREVFGPSLRIDGVEADPGHRDHAAGCGVFDKVYARIPCEARYGIAVLAVPVDTACALLADTAKCADWVMDVCSVKQPLCDAACRLGLQDRFAPTHPMAGKAAGGPQSADAALFQGQPWLLIRGWPACAHVVALVEATGARVTWVESAAEHDAAMAAVSHAIHLVSVSAMLAYHDAEQDTGGRWAGVTGPGFRDVTRLSASPAGFWMATLLANRSAVLAQLARVQARLQEFQQVIAQGDRQGLQSLLEEAARAADEWRRTREEPGR